MLVGVVACIAVLGAGMIGVGALTRGKDYPKQWDPRVAELVAFVEDERGLTFKHPVEVVWLDEKEIGSTMTSLDGAAPLTKAEQAEADAANAETSAELRAFGLLNGDLDLEETASEASEATVAAFYDPDADKIYVPDVELDAIQRSIVVHELTHALQDQYVDLSKRDPAVPDLVWRGLVEGDAKSVESAFLQNEDTDEVAEAAGKQDAKVEEIFEGLSKTPSFMLAFNYAPYALGEPAVALLKDKGGYESVTKALADPPTTELALFDPIGFELNKNYPVGVKAPRVDGTKITEDTLGPLALLFILAETGDDGGALRAAYGWRGDSLVIYRSKDSKVCFAATVDMMTSADAKELATSLQGWVANAPSGGRSAEATGDEVNFRGCDPGVDAQKLRNRSQEALNAVTSVSWVARSLREDDLSQKQARCVALTVVAARNFDQLTTAADFEALGAAIEPAVAGCIKAR